MSLPGPNDRTVIIIAGHADVASHSTGPPPFADDFSEETQPPSKRFKSNHSSATPGMHQMAANYVPEQSQYHSSYTHAYGAQHDAYDYTQQPYSAGHLALSHTVPPFRPAYDTDTQRMPPYPKHSLPSHAISRKRIGSEVDTPQMNSQIGRGNLPGFPTTMNLLAPISPIATHTGSPAGLAEGSPLDRHRERDPTPPRQAVETTATSAPARKSRTNTPWTAAEERLLKTMRDQKISWSEIARAFPRRTEGSVKKHWYKDMHYADFNEHDGAFKHALKTAMKKYERERWKTIGEWVGKPAKACERFAKQHNLDVSDNDAPGPSRS